MLSGENPDLFKLDKKYYICEKEIKSLFKFCPLIFNIKKE